jgi:membrane-bound serine protease (ClpP class)
MAFWHQRAAAWLALSAAGAALLLAGLLDATPGLGQSSRPPVYSLELSGDISPATASWVDKALGDAADQNAPLAIVRLDTPGGLDTSLRDIVKDILAAPMPVIVYVSPNGARAASAGVYITEAADVAAMAPQTNIGSASPISIGPGGESDVLDRKITNDAAAYVRALAAGHGRNPALAERMVRRAVNVTATEAKAAGLIDVIAPSQTALLREVDGFRVKGPKAQTLHTAGLEIADHDMPLQYDVLQLLVNPTIAFLLLSVGLIGLALEIFSPGLIAPGVLGLISFLLGLYGTAQLPVTAAGVLLLVLAMALFIAEAHFNSHGVLGLGGVISLILSGLLLYNTNEGFGVSVPVVIAAGLLIGGSFAFIVQRAVQARKMPIKAGHEELVGAIAEVRVPPAPEGQVFTHGALWRARVSDGAAPLQTGDRVRVESVEGLTLLVRPEAGAEPQSEQEEG